MGRDDKPHFLTGRVSSPRVIDGVLTGFTPHGEDQDGDPHSYQMRALFRLKTELAIQSKLQQQQLQHERELAKIRRASAPTTRKPTRSSKPLNPVVEKKRQIIREFSSMNLEGPKYAAAMDRHTVPISKAWAQQGCPRTYVQAYKLPEWRKRINDEKYRMTKK